MNWDKVTEERVLNVISRLEPSTGLAQKLYADALSQDINSIHERVRKYLNTSSSSNNTSNLPDMSWMKPYNPLYDPLKATTHIQEVLQEESVGVIEEIPFITASNVDEVVAKYVSKEAQEKTERVFETRKPFRFVDPLQQ